MPYVRQTTWLPLAPRIPGLSVRESPRGFRGMGDTGCYDANGNSIDCGGASPGLTIINPGGCYDVNGNSISFGGAAPGLTLVNPGGAVQGNTVPVTGPANSVIIPASTFSSNSLSSWLQQNQNTVLLVGAGLFGIALLKGFK